MSCDEPAAVPRRYANWLEVGQNRQEFVLDFGQSFGESGEIRIHTGIVTNPASAKEFLRILGRSLEQYERTYGALGEAEENPQ